MSALIKQGSAEVKRALPLSKPAAEAPAPKTKLDPRDAALDRLRAEIGQLEKALAEAEKAEAEARKQGREAGFAEAERREAVRIALLEDALADAARELHARLAALENLAPLLARAAIEKLCVPPENWTALIEAMIARQLGALRRSAVLALRVSPEDFDDASAAALGAGACIDPDLASGTARIELKLGQIDLDVREQWTSLASLLDEMASDV